MPSPKMFFQYMITWLAPLFVGGAVVLLAYISKHGFSFFLKLSEAYVWWPFFSLTIGGALLLKLLKIGGKGVEGSGIQQVIATIKLSNKTNFIKNILNLKLGIIKFIAIAGGLSTGFILGLEGPTVYIGACIFYYFKRFLPKDNEFSRHQFIIAGGAAGLAAAYNAPFASIIFAFEELSSKIKFGTLIKITLAVLLSDLVADYFFNYKSYFGELNLKGAMPSRYWTWLLVLSLSGGLFGGAVSWVAIKSLKYVHNSQWYNNHTYPFVMFCGFLIALIGMFAPIFGSGAEITRLILSNEIDISWYYMPLKTLAFLSTFITGLPGGVFTPSLSIGAGFGNYFTQFIDPLWHSEFIAFGMISVLSAVTRAPLTSAFIMVEMSQSPHIIPYALFIAIVSAYTAGIFKIHFYEDLANTILNSNKT